MKKTMTRIFPAGTIAALAWLAGMQMVRADSIPVVNPSFEQPAIAVGAKSTSGITGWQFVMGFGGALRPANVPHPTDGVQVAALPLTFVVDPVFGVEMQQVVPASIAPYVIYTLRVDLIAGADPFSAQIILTTDGPGDANSFNSTWIDLSPAQTKTAMVTLKVFPGSRPLGTIC